MLNIILTVGAPGTSTCISPYHYFMPDWTLVIVPINFKKFWSIQGFPARKLSQIIYKIFHENLSSRKQKCLKQFFGHHDCLWTPNISIYYLLWHFPYLTTTPSFCNRDKCLKWGFMKSTFFLQGGEIVHLIMDIWNEKVPLKCGMYP